MHRRIGIPAGRYFTVNDRYVRFFERCAVNYPRYYIRLVDDERHGFVCWPGWGSVVGLFERRELLGFQSRGTGFDRSVNEHPILGWIIHDIPHRFLSLVTRVSL